MRKVFVSLMLIGGLLMGHAGLVFATPGGGGGPDWDRSSLKVDGTCVEGQAVFTVSNVGDRDMVGTTNWQLHQGTKDGTVLETGTLGPLASGESVTLSFSYLGKLFLRVEQRPGHPGQGEAWADAGPCDSDPTATPTDAPTATPVDPTPVDPTPVDPTPVDPTPVDPTPVDPTPVDPTPVDPTPVGPTATVAPTATMPPGAKAAYFAFEDPCLGDAPYLMLTMSEGVYVYVKNADGAVVFETGSNAGFAMTPGATYLIHPTYQEGYWMVDAAGRIDTTIVAISCPAKPELTATQPVVKGGAGPRASGGLPFAEFGGGLFLAAVGLFGFLRKRQLS